MGDETFADFFRPSQTSSVANDLMEEWEEEVAALKLSKKQKWKGSMRNQSGVIALVKYVPDGVRVDSVTTHFVHKLNAQRKGGRGTELAWIPVLSRSQQAARAAALVSEAEEKSEKKLFIFTTPPGAVCVCRRDGCSHTGCIQRAYRCLRQRGRSRQRRAHLRTHKGAHRGRRHW